MSPWEGGKAVGRQQTMSLMWRWDRTACAMSVTCYKAGVYMAACLKLRCAVTADEQSGLTAL